MNSIQKLQIKGTHIMVCETRTYFFFCMLVKFEDYLKSAYDLVALQLIMTPRPRAQLLFFFLKIVIIKIRYHDYP